MSLNITEIESVVPEIHAAVRDGEYAGTTCPDRWTCVISFRTPSGAIRGLFFSRRPNLVRLNLVPEDGTGTFGGPTTPDQADFIRILDRYLSGAIAGAMRPRFRDRVVSLDLLHGKGDDTRRMTLIFECTGLHPNLFLVDERQVILAVFARSASKKRRLEQGCRYSQPVAAIGVQNSPRGRVEVTRFLESGVPVSSQISRLYSDLDAADDVRRESASLTVSLSMIVESRRKVAESVRVDLEKPVRPGRPDDLHERLQGRLQRVESEVADLTAVLSGVRTGDVEAFRRASEIVAKHEAAMEKSRSSTRENGRAPYASGRSGDARGRSSWNRSEERGPRREEFGESRAPTGRSDRPDNRAPYRREERGEGRAPTGRSDRPDNRAPYRREERGEGRAPAGRSDRPDNRAPYRREDRGEGRAPAGRSDRPDNRAPYRREDRGEGRAPAGRSDRPDNRAPYRREDRSEGRAPAGRSDRPDNRAPYRREERGEGRAPAGRSDRPDNRAPYRREERGEGRAPAGRSDRPDNRAPYRREERGEGRAPAGRSDRPDNRAPYRREDRGEGRAPAGRSDRPDNRAPYRREERGEGRAPAGRSDRPARDGGAGRPDGRTSAPRRVDGGRRGPQDKAPAGRQTRRR